jgi:hypothetical protein
LWQKGYHDRAFSCEAVVKIQNPTNLQLISMRWHSY